MTTERRHAMRPPSWSAWGAKERSLFAEQYALEGEQLKFEERLEAELTPSQWEAVKRYGEACANAEMFHAELIVARLQRYRPDLADLIGFANDLDAHTGDGSSGELLLPIIEAE